MKRVYVAGPYSQGDIAVNVRRAIDAAEELMQAGYWPYVPHLSHFQNLVHPHDWEEWLELDVAWLKACDALVLLLGPSKGAEHEVMMARQFGIAVYTGVGNFLAGVQSEQWQPIAQTKEES